MRPPWMCSVIVRCSWSTLGCISPCSASFVGSHLLISSPNLGCHGIRYVRTARPWLACVAPRGKLPCASDLHSTQEVGPRSPSYSAEARGGVRVSKARVLEGVVERDDERVAHLLHRNTLADDRLGRACARARGYRVS